MPKLKEASACADFRPISITLVLSRIKEKLIVKSQFYLILQSPSFVPSMADQYAFRPTGSTTAAVISILNDLTDMLKINPYVRIVALDFGKAFDTCAIARCLRNLRPYPA